MQGCLLYARRHLFSVHSYIKGCTECCVCIALTSVFAGQDFSPPVYLFNAIVLTFKSPLV